MPEDLNAEIAGGLAEAGNPQEQPDRLRWERFVEISEAIVLAVVAVATAWSGYQAARWDGQQAERYGTASAIRIQADEKLTLGGQQKLLDVSTFNTWIQAKQEGNDALAALYVRRFSPEFETAFDAWTATHPFTNPDAPPGPSFMPEYTNPQIDEGNTMDDEASAIFDEGTEARETSDDYIRTTVVLATVLFLLALSQRFRIREVRIAVLIVSGLLMIYGLATIVSFKRL
ncbi:MAG TPA: hypothetical protein VJ736_00475 [Actinomycetota bacterium]|jgi:hypothetical protein|nr:hypothetical protein [Actinomycetota bacterium]